MRDCMNCVNHTKDGCKVWNCKFTTVEDAKTEFAVEELEKVKEEIRINADIEWNQRVGASKGLEFAIEIIDNHIDKLKGENNPDCRNCDKWKTCENGEKGHANGTSSGYSIGECKDYGELKGEQE